MKEAFPDLAREPYLNFRTFRKDGAPVDTPIWFAHDGPRLVFMTDGRSFKVKRLRRNPEAQVAACTVSGRLTGPWQPARARRLELPADLDRAEALLARKYGLQWRALSFFSRLGRRFPHRAYFEITPAN